LVNFDLVGLGGIRRLVFAVGFNKQKT